MTNQHDIWNRRREQLQEAVRKAVLDLFGHTGSNRFRLSLDPPHQKLWVSAGPTDEPEADLFARYPVGTLFQKKEDGSILALVVTGEVVQAKPAEKSRAEVSAFDQTAPPLWDCACGQPDCVYCSQRTSE